MNLPQIIQQLYNTFTLTGLYSFEFCDNRRNTITEIFFMLPPKTKNLSEPTRSSTVATLGGNYVNDAGNGTKQCTLSGELFFSYVGSPDNPIARDNIGLSNTISGLEEFFKLRWMLLRYRDYTLSENGKVTVPASVMGSSPEITALYKKVAKKIRDKVGALYDEIQLIFHDYDMDDHYFCRINNFSSSQTDTKYANITYTLDIEFIRPDSRYRVAGGATSEIKPTTNNAVDTVVKQLDLLDFNSTFESIQNEISYNSDFLSSVVEINDNVDNISTENENIQSGKSTASDSLPLYVTSVLSAISAAEDLFLTTFLSSSQQTLFDTQDITLGEIVNIDLFSFYNMMQKIKNQIHALQGILNSIVKQDEIRYYSNANDYSLDTDQFDSGDENKVENNTNFYYYTVMEGDTLRIIASRELKDPDKFVLIQKLNNISDGDLMDGTLVGQEIKIPMDLNVLSRGDDNMIFESDFTNIARFLYGIDLKTGSNKQLLISSTGDLLGEEGIENAYQNIENRVLNLKGSLNVFNPNWGTIAIDESNAPMLVRIDRYISDVVEQIQSDPRVESVKVNLDKLRFDGEVVQSSYMIYFVGSDEQREVTA